MEAEQARCRIASGPIAGTEFMVDIGVDGLPPVRVVMPDPPGTPEAGQLRRYRRLRVTEGATMFTYGLMADQRTPPTEPHLVPVEPRELTVAERIAAIVAVTEPQREEERRAREQQYYYVRRSRAVQRHDHPG